MKTFILILAVFSLNFFSSCGRDYSQTTEEAGLGALYSGNASLSDEEKSILYNLCNAFKSKKGNFSSLPFNSTFNFQLNVNDCQGGTDQQSIHATLALDSNIFRFNPASYDLHFIQDVVLDDHPDFSFFCTNPNLPNGDVKNSHDAGIPTVFEFSRSGSNTIVSIKKYSPVIDSPNDYTLNEIHTLSINMTSPDPKLLGLAETYEIKRLCGKPEVVEVIQRVYVP